MRPLTRQPCYHRRRSPGARWPQVARVLDRLRGPAAATDRTVAADVWDIVAKLVVEGQPRDAGKLLQLFASLRREPELSAFASLLLAFPLVDAAAGGEGAAPTKMNSTTDATLTFCSWQRDLEKRVIRVPKS